MSTTRVRLARTGEIEPGTARSFGVSGRAPIAVFNVAGAFYALDDLCPHQRGVLSRGEIDGEEVICPLHAQIFHIPTGRAVEGVHCRAVPVHPVEVERDEVWVRLT